jgi:flagellar secretion chaperone FliS
MFAAYMHPIDRYRQIDVTTSVSQADPHQLIQLLYDGAIAAIIQARHAIATNDTEVKSTTISKALRIVDEGLKASVETGDSPELAENLRGLYDYMVNLLIRANVNSDDTLLAEVAKLLGELRSAWAEISPASNAQKSSSFQA